MDLNKLAELRRIGYAIPATCGLCQHGVFVGPSDWGSCGVHEYEHRKHTDAKRQLSVYRAGVCPRFERDEAKTGAVGAYAEFLRTQDA